ncbi:MAG: DNA repair protein RadA [Armatimonadetes bacterium]|nr:DNA repair protein RadA [Armatimonadota bacterium]
MTKPRQQYRCTACGYASARWLGRCPECGAWGEFRAEEAPAAAARPRRTGEPVRGQALSDVRSAGEARWTTGYGELDRVLGGGIVPGSVVLVGGEPGVGKSTLLLQVGCALSAAGRDVCYFSGEESPEQLRLRAERLGLGGSAMRVFCRTELEAVVELVRDERPAVAVVDSVQTLRAGDVDSAPGSVGQVRECAGRLAEAAKQTGTAVFLVGHVTKEGHLAGPKVMEHIVDVVLLFEGDRLQALKVLRASKNRYGSTNEVGLFEMGDGGLTEVLNPSALLLAERPEGVPGTVALAALEGARPLLLEVQALVAPSPFATPRRVADGVDLARVYLILAVMEQHAGIHLAHSDVYVNVVGGVRVGEPAADLAVALAVASSARGTPFPAETVVFGEIGLTGEVRAVSQTARRLEEAQRLGFESAVVPARGGSGRLSTGGIELRRVASVADAVKMLRRAAAERDVTPS